MSNGVGDGFVVVVGKGVIGGEEITTIAQVFRGHIFLSSRVRR